MDDGKVYVCDLPGARPDNSVADDIPGGRIPTSKDVWAATLTAHGGRYSSPPPQADDGTAHAVQFTPAVYRF